MRKVILIPIVTVGIILLCFLFFAIWIGGQMKLVNPVETAKLSDSVFVLKGGVSNMYLFKKGDRYVAFDAAQNVKKLRKAFDLLSIDPGLVQAVFLTHSDADHVGGLPIFPNATIYLSKDEVPLLNEKKHRHFLGIGHKNSLGAASYTTFSGNDTVTIGGLGITAIATPGHTPGSTCFKMGSAVFTGDLCILDNDSVVPMIKIFTEDMALDSASIRKLASIEVIEEIYTAHSGFCTNAKKALSSWRR